MSPPKLIHASLTQEHVEFMRELAHKAEWLSKSDRLTPQHQKEVKHEARIYREIAQFLEKIVA